MNSNWKDFLLSKQATFVTDTRITFPTPENAKRICPVTHLAVLTVSGKDAGKFLQGQITCNVNDITATQSSLGAICNPKGRVITTFLLIKSAEDFLFVLPTELLQTVKERLQKYVLRSDVKLTNSSDSLCLLGLNPVETAHDAFLASSEQDGVIRIDFNHCIIINTLYINWQYSTISGNIF